PLGAAFRSGTVELRGKPELDADCPEACTNQALREGLRSGCFLPLVSRRRTLGVMALSRFAPVPFTADEIDFLTQIARQVAIAVENALAYKEIAELKEKLAQEKLYLEDEIRGEMDFEGIVGQSSALMNVLQMVDTVAGSDSTVLLLGETGTGKELIARAIHERSRRKERTFVKLNCAAIPTGLLESELFGHEKGAFTGAISQKIGRLELADRGSLFLDEVGDIPPEIQPKLLRALQEREFERLGSTHTKRVDVRLIAATNRDLEKMVQDRQFRNDLYYRLNVFPIRIPPLRDRPEDIPLLVHYFTQKYSRRMEKQIDSIPAAALKKLAGWHWPGNIRELENFVERAVILTRGNTLQFPIDELKNGTTHAPASANPGLNERDQIVRILKESDGRVGGANGAAARLGLKRTTLISRMKKLGISFSARQVS
ncbi:MAG: sigma 54-interacting transcriptional regulator, partial [Actinomycetota bacterium]